MNKNPNKVIIPCRFSFLHCWEPDSVNGSEPKYSVSAIIPKSDTATVNRIKAAIENAKKELLAQMAMAETLKGIAVTEEEVAAFYEENPHLFKKGETVSAKHILVKEEDECKEILSTIENGEKSFEDAAKEKSTCPSGGRGGDLGEFGRIHFIDWDQTRGRTRTVQVMIIGE